jgi:hypothetical protein
MMESEMAWMTQISTIHLLNHDTIIGDILWRLETTGYGKFQEHTWYPYCGLPDSFYEGLERKPWKGRKLMIAYRDNRDIDRQWTEEYKAEQQATQEFLNGVSNKIIEDACKRFEIALVYGVWVPEPGSYLKSISKMELLSDRA